MHQSIHVHVQCNDFWRICTTDLLFRTVCIFGLSRKDTLYCLLNMCHIFICMQSVQILSRPIVFSNYIQNCRYGSYESLF